MAENNPENVPRMGSAEGEIVMVLTTVSDLTSGQNLARGLLSERLAACVQIDGAMTSHYRWNGSQHADQEHRVVIKTLASHIVRLERWLAENHPYDVPQVIVLTATGSDAYVAWARGELDP